MLAKFSKNFAKQYDKSPKRIQSSVDKRIKLFIKNPRSPILKNHKLIGRYKNHRSISITGDWRAIYKEIHRGKTAYFVALGTHSQLYK